MSATSHFIKAGNQQLHYLRWAGGKKLLLAFHGYGREAGNFEVFVAHLQKEYTIISMDLPHHGKSKWANDTVLTPEMLLCVTNELMRQHGVEKASLLGYSLGGRVCLSIVEHISDRIDKVTLLATDGLTANTYYAFFTGNAIGKKIFANMLERPAKYLKMVGLMHRLKLVNESQYKFVMHYLGDDNYRKHLGQRWPALRLLTPDPVNMRKLIERYAIPVTIYMGVYDRIIPAALAEKFKSGLETVQLHILEKGHRIFDDTNASLIAQSLL